LITDYWLQLLLNLFLVHFTEQITKVALSQAVLTRFCRYPGSQKVRLWR